ncbi:MAG: hypothetical protein JEZ11_04055 [Desulfobacterales bacterium]|nr:hypothetical protein [Desulfobacterales bacterium]
MRKKEKDLVKPAGSHSGGTKTGMPPEQSGNAIDAQPKPGRKAGLFPILNTDS